MKKILNFGSLNIDHVYSVDHFVSPGETLGALKYEIFPGGKGLNQSIAMAQAGGEVYHAGKVGSDGLFLVELMGEKGVHTELLDTGGSVSGHAIIQVDVSGQNCILLHGGANQEMDTAYIDSALEQFQTGDLLVLQNEINDVDIIMNKAYEKGLDIALNPSPINDKLKQYPLEKVRWLLLNEIEGYELTGETDPDHICAELLSAYPQAGIVLTLGEAGVIYRDAEECHRHGIYKVSAVDTTAAGDTFTGFFLSELAKGSSTPDALRIATLAASIAVSRKGAASSIPSLKEVMQRLEMVGA